MKTTHWLRQASCRPLRGFRITLLLLYLFTLSLSLPAQNPVVQTSYTADPAPLVVGDRMYVYTSHDEAGADFFWMHDWHVYSTTDMVNWTDHGSPLALETFSWADDRAWAGQAIERDGKFYWYICAHSKLSGGMAIGVAVANSPTGPFRDALGKPLYDDGSWDYIDPTVFIDDDGQAWLMWGNPRVYYLKLNRDMTTYSGSLGRIAMTEESFGSPAMNEREKGKTYRDSYVEGPWLTKRAGTYQLLYAAGGVPEHISYSTAPSPAGPWTYAGPVMPLSDTGSFTNHCGVADYKGHSYFFYHTGKLPGGGGFGRSIAVEEFSYNPDGSFPVILPTDKGVKPVDTFNPYRRVQAETMAFSRGVKTEQNDRIGVYVTDIHNGDYIKLQNVSFGDKSPHTFTARVASGLRGGAIELHLDSLRGQLIGRLEVPATGGWEQWQTLTAQMVNGQMVNGKCHDLYITFTGRKGPKLFNFDWWEMRGKTIAAQVASPDGKLTVTAADGGGLTVSYLQQPMLQIPQLGFEGTHAQPKLKFARHITADYQMSSGKRRHCTNEANEYHARLGKDVTLVLRLYTDGIAFRYEAPSRPQTSEQTTYRIPEGTRRWMMQWSDGYEGFYPPSTTADGKTNHWAYPALTEPAEGLFTLISEANIEHGQSASSLMSEGDHFRVVPDKTLQLQKTKTIQPQNRKSPPTPEGGGSPADVSLPLGEGWGGASWHTPWRCALIGRLADIVESTLITDVSNPTALADTSWIRPGVVSWVYWAHNHGSNDYDIICRYVDMAATLRLPYVLIDAEWDEMRGGKTIEDAVAYARSRGVKPMIWYNSSVGWIDGAPGPKFRLNKPEDREREFAWCQRIGVAGVKIDFFSGDTQQNMDYCIDLLQSAARHHLLVNFHGATIPRGWQRTYPNLLSTEGVYGAEWYNNVSTFTPLAASHNATLPFTRNVVGPMDYTPCAFSDSQHPHITTHAHELALTLLYESGLQHLADRPESFLAQPQAVRDFLSRLPAAWDETRLISGYPGHHAVIARRLGTTWYVAGINGTDAPLALPLAASLPPSAAGAGRSLTLFTDAQPLPAPADTPPYDPAAIAAKWNITTPPTIPDSVTLPPRGGFVLVVEP